MSNIIWYKWRVWCVTDSKFEYVLLEEHAVPTACPVNTAHTIQASENRIVDSRNSEVVKIKEENTPTGGNYAFESIAFTALANQITTYTTTFPIPINVIDGAVELAAENTGDIITWKVAPNTVIGVVTADVTASDTVINVSSTVLDTIQLGFHLDLFDGVNNDNCLRVIDIDTDNSQVTVEQATTNSFAAATPTYVRMTVVYVNAVEMGHPGQLSIAESKAEATYLPANTPLVCEYDNKSAMDDKRFVAYIEYLY